MRGNDAKGPFIFYETIKMEVHMKKYVLNPG